MRRSVRDLRNSPGGRPLIIQQHQSCVLYSLTASVVTGVLETGGRTVVGPTTSMYSIRHLAAATRCPAPSVHKLYLLLLV
ncbi:hypothetical protein C356_05154 [Cryptococcus neoformans c45]|nr:hypothetical protein C356_05154 [Cryptococcus neoformans var. grubii c45]